MDCLPWTYLVGTGTSVRSPRTTAWLRRMKQDRVRSRKSTSPTRMLLASAPGGIFLMKWVLPLCCCSLSSVPLPGLAIDWLLGLLTMSSVIDGRFCAGRECLELDFFSALVACFCFFFRSGHGVQVFCWCRFLNVCIYSFYWDTCVDRYYNNNNNNNNM